MQAGLAQIIVMFEAFIAGLPVGMVFAVSH